MRCNSVCDEMCDIKYRSLSFLEMNVNEINKKIEEANRRRNAIEGPIKLSIYTLGDMVKNPFFPFPLPESITLTERKMLNKKVE